MALGVRGFEIGLGFRQKRVYESVIILGGAIRTGFVPQCIVIACRAGRLNFLPAFRVYCRQNLASKVGESIRHLCSSFSFKCDATKVKTWLI